MHNKLNSLRKIKKKHIAKPNIFDVIIVGAGPAGIFACYEILQKKPEKRIALIEMGNRIENRGKNELMTGFGGAGTYSDGKLHYTPVLSHEKAFHLIEVDDYQRILDEIEIVFRHFGVDSEFYPKDTLETKNLVEESEKQNIELVIRKIQHVEWNGFIY